MTMKFVLLLTALYTSLVVAFSFSSYNVGLRGIYPRRHYHTVDFESPALKITRWNSRCDYGSLFITPRGPWVSGAARGPAMLDAKGELVWMDNTVFTQSMNLNVQTYKGKEYLTFWSKRVKTKRGETSVKAKEPKTSYVMVRFPILNLLPLPASFATLYRLILHLIA